MAKKAQTSKILCFILSNAQRYVCLIFESERESFCSLEEVVGFVGQVEGDNDCVFAHVMLAQVVTHVNVLGLFLFRPLLALFLLLRILLNFVTIWRLQIIFKRVCVVCRCRSWSVVVLFVVIRTHRSQVRLVRLRV